MVVGCTWTKSGKINASRGETSGNDGSPHRFPGKYVRNVGARVTAREITRRKIKSPACPAATGFSGETLSISPVKNLISFAVHWFARWLTQFTINAKLTAS